MLSFKDTSLLLLLLPCIFLVSGEIGDLTVLCRSYTSCDQCLLDPNCGWCQSTRVCVPGNYSGPVEGNCTLWDFYGCPTPSPTPTPSPLPPLNSSSWVTLGNGPAHTGQFPATTAMSRKRIAQPILLYNFTSPQATVYQVAVAEGLVFLVSSNYFGNATLYALDELKGFVHWTYEFGSVSYINPPTYNQGIVYLQRTDTGQRGLLYAINATNGKLKWTAPYSAQWESYLAPMVANNQVCVNAGTYGGLYCYALATGSQIFFTGLPQYDLWTPAYENGRLFAFVSTYFYEINFYNGTILWNLQVNNQWTGYEMGRAVVLDLPLAFIISNTGVSKTLNAINVDTRTFSWNSTISCPQTYKPMPAVEKGSVYLPCDSAIYILDEKTGQVIDTIGLQSSVSPVGQPIITPNEILVPTNGGIFAFSKTTQESTWNIPIPSTATLTISYNGRLFATYGRTLLAFQV